MARIRAGSWQGTPAAAGVFLLSAAGQLALERARAHGGSPPLPAAIALAGSAALAVLALRRSDLLPAPPRPLELPRFRAALYAACLPAAVCLVLALVAHLAAPGHALSIALWLLGLALLMVPGVVDWRRNVRRRSSDAKLESRRLAAAAGVLFIVAFGVRTWGGIDRIPGWLDSDEAATGMAGRKSFAEGPRALFGFWEMGEPSMALFVSQLAAWPFGGGLRGLRLGSALLGSLAVVFLFDFGRRLVGSRTAFVAALLFAVNHAFLHYSRVGHTYVDTPFFASLVLALLLRVMTGGSFLALTGAGVALGIGAATYVATEVLPAAIAATLAGWAIILLWPSRRTLLILGFLGGIAALVCAPMIATVLRMPLEVAYQRIPTISLLRADGFRQLRDAYGAGSVSDALGQHVGRTISIFNSGSDYFKAYGANRALDDPVTAALIPAAGALLLSRLSSPIGWASLVFTGAYLTGAVLLSTGPPTYHRILVVLLFSSLGVAWALTGLLRTLAVGLNARRWLPAATMFAVVGASAWLNLHYYFRALPRTALTDAGFGLGRLICRYSGSHTVIDATALDGHEYVPVQDLTQTLECPGARRIRVQKTDRLWMFPELTEDRRVVLIVPTVVESAIPGEPRGYRLTRRIVDRSIQLPAELPLSVREYERVR